MGPGPAACVVLKMLLIVEVEIGIPADTQFNGAGP